MMKIYKKNDTIVIEIPYWSKRLDPYMEDKDVGRHPTLIGIIYNDKDGNREMGFARVIDMGYKGKPDQNTGIMIHYWRGDKEDFIKLCKELKLGVYEYPICQECKKTIYGCHTANKDGQPLCFKCEKKRNKNED